MNALSRLFASLRPNSPERGNAHYSRRRRRAQRTDRLISGETLEPKQLLAVDVVNQFADQSLTTSAPVTIAITSQFDVTDVLGTVVKFETNAPIGGTPGLTTNDFYVELYDKAGAAGTLTPTTVNNFLSYVSDGSYDDTMIHRSVSDFVIQGGGFTAPSVAADEPGSDPTAIPTKGTITNEPGNSNLRGTLAMAKLGGQPNSATSQWFVNLSDNTFLDSDNGGYAVFGEVLGDGMTVVDVMGTALTYDATTYYSNGAFSDLPLWNVNADNIVLPEDFVKFEAITALSDESELMTYTVTTSDTSKLTASINAAGDLVLTPVAGQTGPVNVTVTATSKTDGSTVSDTFAVGLSSDAGGGGDTGGGGGGQDPAPTLTAIETAGTVTLNRDETGKLYAGSTPIFISSTTELTLSSLNGYTPVAVDNFGGNGGNRLVLKHSGGSLLVWGMTDAWVRDGSASGAGIGWAYAGTAAFDTAELDYGTDFDLNGTIGPATAPTLTAIESVGTVLNRDASGGYYAGSSAIYISATTLLATSTLSSSYTPVAVEDFGTEGGKRLVLEHSSGSLLVWSLSDNWVNQVSTDTGIGWVYLGTPAFDRAETAYGVDFNGNGTIGAPSAPTLTAIESVGSVSLNRDASGLVYAGSEPIYVSGTTQLSAIFGNYTPVAAEDFGVDGGKQVVLRYEPNGSLLVWQMSASWTRTGNVGRGWIYASDRAGIAAAESRFGVDFNDDGTVGATTPTLTAIESAGNVVLNRDANGLVYAGDQPVYVGTTQLSVTFGNYTAVAVEDFGAGGGKRLVLKHSGGSFLVWSLSDTFARSDNVGWIYSSDAAGINEAETAYGLDFDGNSTIGAVFTAIESSGVVLNRDASGRLYAGSEPIYISAGNQLTLTSLSGYTPVAVEDFSDDGGKRVMLRYESSGSLLAWEMSATWTKSGQQPWIYSSDDAGVNTAEAAYGVDFNRDTIVGLSTIEGRGTKLNRDAAGNLYAGTQPLYLSGTTRITLTSFNGYVPLAIEDFGDSRGRQLVLRYENSGSLLPMAFTSEWVRDRNLDWVYASNPAAILAAEAEFEADFDNDGTAGVTLVAVESAGTVLNRDSSGGLYAGSEPIYLRPGRQLTTSTLIGYSVLAVEDFGSNDRRLLLRYDASGSLREWTLDASWVKSGDLDWIYGNDLAGLSDAATRYGITLG